MSVNVTIDLLLNKNRSIESVEPIMLEQIGRISQQIGYFLHRANMHSEHNVLNREIHSVPTLLDSLCNALNKVYQRKGVVLTLDMSPEITFLGEKNDPTAWSANPAVQGGEERLSGYERLKREWPECVRCVEASPFPHSGW